MYLCYNIVVQC